MNLHLAIGAPKTLHGVKRLAHSAGIITLQTLAQLRGIYAVGVYGCNRYRHLRRTLLAKGGWLCGANDANHCVLPPMVLGPDSRPFCNSLIRFLIDAAEGSFFDDLTGVLSSCELFGGFADRASVACKVISS